MSKISLLVCVIYKAKPKIGVLPSISEGFCVIYKAKPRPVSDFITGFLKGTRLNRLLYGALEAFFTGECWVALKVTYYGIWLDRRFSHISAIRHVDV